MKKVVLFVFGIFLFLSSAEAQVDRLITDRTNGRVTLGADLFTDIAMGESYENFNLRNINQGVDAYITYNFPIADSKHTFSAGVGFTAHNFYLKDAYIDNPYAEYTVFTMAENNVKRSKINVFYLDIPMEVNFRMADKFKVSFGLKIGFNMGAKTKFIGTLNGDDHKVHLKYTSIENVEKVSYSATVRVAYRWINIFGAYQFSRTFKDEYGPQIMPLSIGIGIRPF